MKTFVIVAIVASAIVCVVAKPQYNVPASAQQPAAVPATSAAPAPSSAPSTSAAPASSGAPASSVAPAASSASSGNSGSSSSVAPAPSSYSSSSSTGSATTGGASSGGLTTMCTSGDGKKFSCSGVNKADITLRSEHILWLPGGGGDSSVYDIEVPNYTIDELIKAGFKKGQASNTNININLKKPEQTYEAQTGKPETVSGKTAVKLQYEPVTPVKVHFPVDKPYQPLSGPLLPPAY